ncbi:ATP-binding cassette domain-containing protein [Pengzhenrongella phosphoraccumulans]|uniref:ABC transporter ATP-binding protein n=1 Tax=Pengzhenrongella phosphoraccumulans TaxID=3114394 RepID=UPI00388FA113
MRSASDGAPRRPLAPAAGPNPPRAVGLTARGWGWRHSGRRAWALRGVDLDIAPGERVLLLGASGAGKSTLLAAAAGLLDDGAGEAAGELCVGGLDARLARLSGTEPGSSRTGLLLQDPDAQTVLSRCGDDVAFGLENHGLPADLIWPRVDAALQAVGFAHGRARSTAALSGGERQRLALAGVVAMRPGLLLLDEPTAMIDPDGARMLVGSVASLLGAGLGDPGGVERVDAPARAVGVPSATLLVVEHRVAQWLPLVTRIVVLEPGGGVMADGPAGEVLTEQGPTLFRQGVWVPPRYRPASGRRPLPAAGDRAVVLRARGLAVRRTTAPPVLSDVDLDVRAGEALFLTGPNGAGKSTLALALAGLSSPAAGEVEALPALAAGAGPSPVRWRARELVTRIGMVFQEPQHQFVAATVEAELAVGPRRAGVPAVEAAARIADVLLRLRLDRLALANPFTLSGGEQRRLSVATALVTRPRVLILDEPTFGQDARTWAELVELLRELLSAGTALVCATHDRELVDAFLAEGRGRELCVSGGAVHAAGPAWRAAPVVPEALVVPGVQGATA